MQIDRIKLKSVFVNDFMLKTMDLNMADIDLPTFTYAVLMGMMERVIPKEFY